MATWANDVFEAFLKSGLWHDKVDDNVSGEKLSPDWIGRVVNQYQANPRDPVALANMGLFALAIGIYAMTSGTS